MDIKWVEKRRKCESGAEVEVAISNNGHKNITRIAFIKGSWQKITKRTHMMVGLTATRMYFDETVGAAGFKISRAKMPDGRERLTGYVRLPGERTEWVGAYDLKFDAAEKMWFIEKGGRHE